MEMAPQRGAKRRSIPWVSFGISRNSMTASAPITAKTNVEKPRARKSDCTVRATQKFASALAMARKGAMRARGIR